MRILSRVWLVGSGAIGLSDPGDCHVYAVRGDDGDILVDTGGGRHPERVAEVYREDGGELGRVRAILLTHAHPDHVGGVPWWLEHTPAVVLASPLALQAPPLREARAGGRACSALSPGPNLPRVDGVEPHPLPVPGHSPDSVCYLFETGQGTWLFSGDVVYYGGLLGLINYEGSSLADYRAHLPVLAHRRVDALFPGHQLFVVRGGQRHIDRALASLQGIFAPLSLGQLVPP